MRRVIAITAAAGLLVTLSACSVSAPSGGCTPGVESGKASSAVTVSGEVGATPTVDFPTPLVPAEAQVSVVSEGDGGTVYDGDLAFLSATVFDATSGDTVFDTAEAALFARTGGEAVEEALECATVGSRLVVTVPATDASSAAVYVLDVVDSYTTKATGRIEVPQQGLPSVVTAPDGTPGITIVGDAPTELKYSTLITGEGAKTKTGDAVLVQYTAVNWDTGAVIATTWGDDTLPAGITLQPYDPASGGISAGAATALTGATVGSQVIVVLPPSAYETGTDLDLPAGATVAIVYDILGIL